VATHDFFAKVTQISHFFALPNFIKWANLQLPLNAQKRKVLQLQGGLALLPLPPPGALPVDPAVGFALRPLL